MTSDDLLMASLIRWRALRSSSLWPTNKSKRPRPTWRPGTRRSSRSLGCAARRLHRASVISIQRPLRDTRVLCVLTGQRRVSCRLQGAQAMRCVASRTHQWHSRWAVSLRAPSFGACGPARCRACGPVMGPVCPGRRTRGRAGRATRRGPACGVWGAPRAAPRRDPRWRGECVACVSSITMLFSLTSQVRMEEISLTVHAALQLMQR